MKAATQIDQDLTCVTCGYNLRGLSPDGRCPECGELISKTISGVRPPLPSGYRMARLALLTLCAGGWCLVAAANAFRVQHPRHLFYFWGDVATVGILAGVLVLAGSLGLLFFSRSARRDGLIWACLLVSLWASYWGMCVITQARE